MDTVHIGRDDPRYPATLGSSLGEEAPASLAALGNLSILERDKLALFCSVRCPGNLIVRSYDLAHRLRELDGAVLGGFHSPMEQEWLGVLLRGPAPVILCPARSIARFRAPVEYRKPLEEGRLLVLSPFIEGERRATVDTALHRNRFVAALADWTVVVHAAPSGKTEQLCREILVRRRRLYTLEHAANGSLMALGAISLGPGDLLAGRFGSGGIAASGVELSALPVWMT